MRRTFENVYGYYESELTKNVRDWKELFDYGPKPRPDLPDEAPENRTLDGRNQWPEAPPGFRWACSESFFLRSVLSAHFCFVLRRLSVSIWVEAVAVPEAWPPRWLLSCCIAALVFLRRSASVDFPVFFLCISCDSSTHRVLDYQCKDVQGYRALVAMR